MGSFEEWVDVFRYFGAFCGAMCALAFLLEVYYQLRKDWE